MKRLAILLPFALALSTAVAEARPDSLRQSCARTQAMVQQHGAIILGSGRNVYERVVVNIAFCGAGERLDPYWVPTRDTNRCFAGYRCVPADPLFDDDW